MNVAALKHTAINIADIRRARPKALNRGWFVTERGEELEGKLGPVKGLSGKLRYAFFDFNGVHAGNIGRVRIVAKARLSRSKRGHGCFPKSLP